MTEPKTVTLAHTIAAKVRDQVQDVHILMYRSMAYDSVYIKFDYGVGNSLRIADHSSRKSHLDYRFNVLLDITGKSSAQGDKYTKFFYGPDVKAIDVLVVDIVDNILAKRSKFGMNRYSYYMNINADKLPDSWVDYAVEI